MQAGTAEPKLNTVRTVVAENSVEIGRRADGQTERSKAEKKREKQL